VYGFSGPDFTYCLDECRVGGQGRLLEKTTAPIAVTTRTTRSYDSCVRDCTNLIYIPPAYGVCLTTCYFRGRREIIDPLDALSVAIEPFAGEKEARSSRKLEETASEKMVPVREARRDVYPICRKACEYALYDTPKFVNCMYSCFEFEQKKRSLEATPGKITGVVDAVTETDHEKLGAGAEKRKARCFNDAFHPPRRVVTYDTYYKGPYVKVLLWG
jgi:hypothetical protein